MSNIQIKNKKQLSLGDQQEILRLADENRQVPIQIIDTEASKSEIQITFEIPTTEIQITDTFILNFLTNSKSEFELLVDKTIYNIEEQNISDKIIGSTFDFKVTKEEGELIFHSGITDKSVTSTNNSPKEPHFTAICFITGLLLPGTVFMIPIMALLSYLNTLGISYRHFLAHAFTSITTLSILALSAI